MKQIDIDFQPGLTERFPDFGDCLRASVYGAGRQLKAVAADLDMSSSELSRKLSDNPNDPVYFPAKRLPNLISATGDLSPIYWLIEEFLDAPEDKRTRAVAGLAALLPKIEALLRSAGSDS